MRPITGYKKMTHLLSIPLESCKYIFVRTPHHGSNPQQEDMPVEQISWDFKRFTCRSRTGLEKISPW